MGECFGRTIVIAKGMAMIDPSSDPGREVAVTTFTSDGTTGEIFVRTWRAGNPAYGVLLAHGIGEHGGRYCHVARRLVGDGAVVYAGDKSRSLRRSAFSRSWTASCSVSSVGCGTGDSVSMFGKSTASTPMTTGVLMSCRGLLRCGHET